jgi:hypothetical protein
MKLRFRRGEVIWEFSVYSACRVGQPLMQKPEKEATIQLPDGKRPKRMLVLNLPTM